MTKLHTFGEIMNKILKNEGGYVNDADDRGGETKYGIAKRSHPEVDIKNLTVEKALDIYKKKYWKPSRAEKLDPKLRYQYFDFVVNAGQGNAVKVLQKACNGKNKKKIVVDGRIGPNTIKAAKNLELERFKAYKCLYYANIILKNPVQEKFFYGWYNRIHNH